MHRVQVLGVTVTRESASSAGAGGGMSDELAEIERQDALAAAKHKAAVAKARSKSEGGCTCCVQ